MSSTRQSPLVSALSLGALAVLLVAASSPVWWVSLTAPNYPPEAFPDGIRIHFSFNGVSNGCTTAPQTSRVAQETIQEDLGWRTEGGEAPKEDAAPQKDLVQLDCMHEMNTINHYVGMHPMGVGAPVERLLGKFIIAFFGVMLLGFAVPWARARTWTLGAGFAAVAGWMLLDLYALGHLSAFATEFVGEAGQYFRDPARIEAWASNVRLATGVMVAVLLGAMVFMIVGSVKWPRFQLVLGLVPAGLPLFFVGSFAAWLWFFGHNLHPWGAFTLKPFMPTVFGDGKVAQFTTHSYPHYGFGLLLLASVMMIAAVARRRWELHDEAGEKPLSPTAHPQGPTTPLGPPATAAGPKA